MDRRDFLKTVSTATAGLVTADGLGSYLQAQTPPQAGALRRKLGTTGETVSAIGLGGYHIGVKSLSEDESAKIIHTAIDNGINFLDNCWDYNNGESEVRMGKALQDGYRQRAFLMTKIDGRTKAAAAQQINDSLSRFKTDHIDLLQFHEIIRFEDPDRIFAEGGALEAALDAKKAGKIRFIGFTGHKDPAIHLRMLEVAQQHKFHFDTVQMPVNVMDAHFRSFAHQVLPVATKQGIGVLAMKSMGSGEILKSNSVTAIECLRYALSQPVSVVITGMDSMDRLQQAMTLMKDFKPMNATEQASVLSKTKTAALSGKFEPFKTATMFDGTAHNPQWLG